MLTLLDTLTPHQLRRIDEAVHKALHPDDLVEWRWCKRCDDIWEPISQTESAVLEKSGYKPAHYSTQPCLKQDGFYHPISDYGIPGVANNEVAEKILGKVTLRAMKDDFGFSMKHYRIDFPWGLGSDLPRAILATFLDWQGIGIPEMQP